MTDFEYFVAACVFCLFVLGYAAAVGDDPPAKRPESSLDL